VPPRRHPAPAFRMVAVGSAAPCGRPQGTTCERFRGLAADDRNRAGSERGFSGGPDDCVSSMPVV
jgi:hypothetical protein